MKRKTSCPLFITTKPQLKWLKARKSFNSHFASLVYQISLQKYFRMSKVDRWCHQWKLPKASQYISESLIQHYQCHKFFCNWNFHKKFLTFVFLPSVGTHVCAPTEHETQKPSFHSNHWQNVFLHGGMGWN